MATEPKRPDPEEDMDEPTEEEIEQQKRSEQTGSMTTAGNCRTVICEKPIEALESGTRTR